GDLLLGWERPVSGSVPAARGTLATPFELEDLQAEQAPLGPVSLLVDRAGARRSASMPPWPWGLAARPAMDAATLTEYLAAGELISKQDAAGARSLEGLADGAGARPADACWLRLAAARGYAAAADAERAEDLLSAAAATTGFEECQVHADDVRADL